MTLNTTLNLHKKKKETEQKSSLRFFHHNFW